MLCRDEENTGREGTDDDEEEDSVSMSSDEESDEWMPGVVDLGTIVSGLVAPDSLEQHLLYNNLFDQPDCYGGVDLFRQILTSTCNNE